MQAQQKLMIDFPEFPSVLVRMLNQCIKEPHRYVFPPSSSSLQWSKQCHSPLLAAGSVGSHLAVFIFDKTGDARLDFIQNMEYKFVELMSLNFVAADLEQVKRTIHYRYNVVKVRCS